MKRIFTLLVAMALMATSFAQVSVKTSNVKESPFNGKFIQKSAKSAEQGWISTADYLENYWGEGTIVAGSSNYLQNDSLGLVLFSDTYSHPWFYSVSQTFDFESNFWDLASLEGDFSLVNTSSFNVDSLAIFALYLRENNFPAGAVDTLIVGVMTDLIETETPVYSYTNYDNSCFYYFEFDPQTSLPVGAQIFKVPLDESFISEEAEDGEGYYLTEIDLPLNLTNVTGKAWNIAYTFKPGYTVGMNDTLPSHFHFTTWKSPDPSYTIDGNNPDICDNLSHGQYNCSFTNGNIDYYYPAFAFGSSAFHYPRMYVKVACSDCAYVGVEEMEKENITVYPNPATSNFTVKLNGDENAHIQLFNLVGQQVYSETAANTTTINVSNLKAGIYMLKVSQNGKIYTSKVIVK